MNSPDTIRMINILASKENSEAAASTPGLGIDSKQNVDVMLKTEANTEAEKSVIGKCVWLTHVSSSSMQCNEPLTMESQSNQTQRAIANLKILPKNLQYLTVNGSTQHSPLLFQVKSNQNVHENEIKNDEGIGNLQTVSPINMTIVTAYPLQHVKTNPVQHKSLPSVEGIAGRVFPITHQSINNITPVKQHNHLVLKSKQLQTFCDDTTISLKAPVNGIRNSNTQHSQKPHLLDAAHDKIACSCSISHCIKRYCKCFSNGQFCDMCKCHDCFNNMNHEEQRQKYIQILLQRNKKAFQRKISEDALKLIQQHTRGCKCKRSKCQKRYCECYEANIFCSELCKCEKCLNNNVQQNYIQNLILPHSLRKIFKHEMVSEKIAEAVVLCMLAQALEAQAAGLEVVNMEEKILEEFASSVAQIIEISQNKLFS